VGVVRGRPKEEREGFRWLVWTVRALTLGWAMAIGAALVDELGTLPHLPFSLAMAMAGLLVVSTFVLTHKGVPSWRGDTPAPARPEDKQEETDLLTDLPTLRYLQERLEDEFARSRRMGKQVSVVLVDINNLTAVNKEYGVKAGDEVLRHVARAVDGTRRYNDVVARLGDDEFGVLLMDCTEDGVRAFIERLEERLSRESAVADVGGRTISLWAGVCSGSATSQPQMGIADEVLESAMESLNTAKMERERRRRTWLSA
jgi:diguanylate cyclase (GGDEF)-like protein